MKQLQLFSLPVEEPTGSLAARAERFCSETPHRRGAFAQRNWGGILHRLCSYQGKLKPAIAHFLVAWFTEPGNRVLDPLAGVGTVPLEARRLGREAIANDLSPLAATVCRAKLLPFSAGEVDETLEKLSELFRSKRTLSSLTEDVEVDFGLNGRIRDYFHPDTLREVLIARQFFFSLGDRPPIGVDVVRTSLLHILHGNRPYALSRRSHPVTPFAPTGPSEYRSLEVHLRRRLRDVVPPLLALAEAGLRAEVHHGDFRDLETDPVDAVITSPPFAQSLRFWSTNWMRLWLAGWDPEDFKSEPARYLETEQRVSFAPYKEFAERMARLMKPGGVLIMHLGETADVNMAQEVAPHIAEQFDVIFSGRESIEDGETHGLSDKGSTLAHHYVFATRR